NDHLHQEDTNGRTQYGCDDPGENRREAPTPQHGAGEQQGERSNTGWRNEPTDDDAWNQLFIWDTERQKVRRIGKWTRCGKHNWPDHPTYDEDGAEQDKRCSSLRVGDGLG